jgi:hypothetical protein
MTSQMAAAAAAAIVRGVPTGIVHSGGIIDTTSTTWLMPFRQKPPAESNKYDGQQYEHP